MKDVAALTENKKLVGVIIPIASLVIAGILVILVIIPQIKGYFDTRKQVEDLKTQVSDLNKHADNLAKINVDDFNHKLTDMANILPADGDPNLAVAYIEAGLSATGLQLQSLAYTSASSGVAEATTDPASNLKIVVEVTGDIDKLEAFITKLEQGPQIIRINGLDFTRDKNNNLTIDLTLNSYYQPEAKVPASLPANTDSMSSTDNSTLDKLESRLQLNPPIQFPASASAIGKPNPFQ